MHFSPCCKPNSISVGHSKNSWLKDLFLFPPQLFAHLITLLGPNLGLVYRNAILVCFFSRKLALREGPRGCKHSYFQWAVMLKRERCVRGFFFFSNFSSPRRRGIKGTPDYLRWTHNSSLTVFFRLFSRAACLRRGSRKCDDSSQSKKQPTALVLCCTCLNVWISSVSRSSTGTFSTFL